MKRSFLTYSFERSATFKRYINYPSKQNKMQNSEMRKVAEQIGLNREIYDRFRNEFDTFYNFMSIDPDNPQLWTSLGSTDKTRFIKSFFEYLNLLGRGEVPPLRQVLIEDGKSKSEILDILKNYADNEIEAVIGESIQDAPTRTVFLDKAADILSSYKFEELTPERIAQCANPEDVRDLRLFIGFSRPYTPTYCLDIDKTLQLWNKIKEDTGKYELVVPTNPGEKFTPEDLERLKVAIYFARDDNDQRFARETIKNLNTIVREVNYQNLENAETINRFRRWINDSSQNRKALREFLQAMYDLGMYIKGWQGPGRSYVQRGAYNEENVLSALIKYANIREVNKDWVNELETITCDEDSCRVVAGSNPSTLLNMIQNPVYDIDEIAPLLVDTAAYYFRHIFKEHRYRLN